MKNPITLKFTYRETKVFSHFLKLKVSELLQFRVRPKDFALCILIELFFRLEPKFLEVKLKKDKNSFKLQYSETLALKTLFSFESEIPIGATESAFTLNIILGKIHKALADCEQINLAIFEEQDAHFLATENGKY